MGTCCTAVGLKLVGEVVVVVADSTVAVSAVVFDVVLVLGGICLELVLPPFSSGLDTDLDLERVEGSSFWRFTILRSGTKLETPPFETGSLNGAESEARALVTVMTLKRFP